MSVVSGLRVGSHTFSVEYIYDDLEIKRAYLGGGGIDIWPLLRDEIKLAIFDEIFTNELGSQSKTSR